MYLLLFLVFIIGYIFIALEHQIHVDKAAVAILTGVICWTILIIGRETLITENRLILEHGSEALVFLDSKLLEHIGEIAEILFFLLAAMTIVELVDAHKGFEVVTNRITTENKIVLLWIVCTITFFFSAALDNLTTSIVMAALLKRILYEKEELWFFGGMVVIAANAGGAWSPIGDVTTIMLWIGGQISALKIILTVFLPSVICFLVPLGIVTIGYRRIKQPKVLAELDLGKKVNKTTVEQKLVFFSGLGGLLLVPIFKSITHLPPFMGMLFSLGLLWIMTEVLHKRKTEKIKSSLQVSEIIRRIDTPSILFFLGILLAVASLQSSGHLQDLSLKLNQTFTNEFALTFSIGLLSAIVDNVPLVAGTMGMYSLEALPQDSTFWHLLAYCAGTGGSVLIIGSAAGVAIMGQLKMDFIWYLKKITLLALIGYATGMLVLYWML